MHRPAPIALLALAACSNYEVNRLGAVDQDARSIAAPQNGDALCGHLKAALRGAGWVVDGPAPRYRLSVDSSFEDTVLFSSSRIYSFFVTVTDTASGRDVVSMSGHATDKIIAAKLLDALAAR